MVIDISKATVETIERMVRENRGGIWKGWYYAEHQKWSPFEGHFNDDEVIVDHIITNLPEMSEREIDDLWIYGLVKIS